MTIRINNEGLTVPVSKSLVDYLSTLLADNRIPKSAHSITFNFKDLTYNNEDGGFHPVEIHIECTNQKSNEWSLRYITDFCLVGMGVCAELAIDADFNFELDTFQTMYGSFPLASADEYYLLWEANFINYAKELEVFNIKITEGD